MYIKLKNFIKQNPKLRRIALNTLHKKVFIYSFTEIPWYLRDLRDLKKQSQLDSAQEYEFKIKANYPCLNDKKACAGGASQYLVQDLWAAQKIYDLNSSEMHYDIGSRVDGFITHLLSFGRQVTLIDIRPLPYNIDANLRFVQADATNLESIESNSIYSLSALCSLEHFGLGRYGDAVDPTACFKAFKAIQRVVKPGGKVYISLPIGQNEIQFNAHRVFNPQTVISLFKEMVIVEFSIAPTNHEFLLIKNVNPKDYKDLDSSTRPYFGLFEFQKVGGGGHLYDIAANLR